jgi:hypothetical protein
MDHEPEAVFLVRLKLQKMVSTPECTELNTAITSLQLVESRIAEQRCFQVRGQSVRHGRGRVPIGWNSLVQAEEDRGRREFIGKQVSYDVERDGRHAAADVTTDCGRINQIGRGQDRANANFARQMDVRHHGDVLYIVSSRKVLD